jgi:inosine/xanthosine triphosphate pyrophosphatase family protein
MTADVKDTISHRGRALREIAPVVVEVLSAR